MASNVPSHVLGRRSGGRAAGNKYGVSPAAERRHPQTNELFHSKAELKRYLELELMQRAGHIAKLERQVHFPLIVKGYWKDGVGVFDNKVGTYVADAVYEENGVRVVEDVKGFRTPEYELKKKLMFALHGIAIREIAA